MWRATEPPLLAVDEQATEPGLRHVLLHFHASPYFTSAGIALVLRIAAHAHVAGQQLARTGLIADFARMFRMAGLEAYAPIYPSEAEALAGLADTADASVA